MTLYYLDYDWMIKGLIQSIESLTPEFLSSYYLSARDFFNPVTFEPTMPNEKLSNHLKTVLMFIVHLNHLWRLVHFENSLRLRPVSDKEPREMGMH